ncbi:DUF6115 domain-containing protein [Crassaminicella indica]|uniref:Helix-turn-helix domain-containing protein n=1 Tax=Crassaminicella indica TaxID=2855394 RepID=A0ABX8RAN3_9CLOT|nr:hypothetical protein [Crassaminicella indica]QXM06120.1 hypothetical protein KVH43_12325 [Crassaminicella indica]
MGDYIFFSIGIIIVIISIIMLRKNTNIQSEIKFQNNESNEIELLASIDLAENIIKELKEISEDTIKTLDEKTDEIYKMIKILDEKMEQYSSVLNEKKSKNNREFTGASYKLDLLNTKKEDDDLDIDTDKKKILQLYYQGYTPAQIAKKVDKGIGEVQLICSLKKR